MAQLAQVAAAVAPMVQKITKAILRRTICLLHCTILAIILKESNSEV
jgi:hypothetical protein